MILWLVPGCMSRNFAITANIFYFKLLHNDLYLSRIARQRCIIYSFVKHTQINCPKAEAARLIRTQIFVSNCGLIYLDCSEAGMYSKFDAL